MSFSRVGSGRDGYEVIVAGTLEEVEALREAWQTLLAAEATPNINADIDRYISIVRSMGESTRPCVIVLKRGERVETLVAGRIEPRRVKIGIGYARLFNPALRFLSVIHGGIIGRSDEETITAAFEEINAMMSRKEIDAVLFNHLRTDSKAYAAARKAAGILRRNGFPTEEPHWVMTLPESMEAFYSSLSKATRKTLRRALRHMEKEYPGQVEHAHYQRPGEVDEAVGAMRQVSLKTYQFGMGVGFAGDQSERERLVDAAGKGWLRGHVLRLAGRPVAFELALQYGGTYFLCSSGYDPDMGEASPGKVLFVMLLEELCRSQPVERLDFGFGDAEYKRTYCDVHWMEADVYVFGARPRLVLINLLRTAVIAASLAARWIVGRLGVLRRVKRKWRDRFQSGVAKPRAEEEDAQEK